MAQAVVPAMQCQVGAKAAVRARPAASAGGRVWGVRRSGRGTSGFKAMSLSTASTGVVPRLEQMLNMDTKPYTDKIIAEYIWLASLCSCTANDLNCLKIVFVLFSIFSVVASCIQCL